MSSLDLLERKLLRLLVETDQVRLKRRLLPTRRSLAGDARLTDKEKRELVSLFLRRMESLPPAKRQEVMDLLRLYEEQP
ncbi:hypothetical protein G3578_13880 [Brevibacillus sp. SYP-B805]|uniref:hypothetical protein n=1 Tax=Brevibacillus sp. SYP-B805 TaxID=1578199 RepID=UPI0013EBD99A|nr:hypothetical protein [Brevibacillus sp. SYP-B805]NGQ96251.1 hypothetical protein [Brevibacillus sp. SYP-B805]